MSDQPALTPTKMMAESLTRPLFYAPAVAGLIATMFGAWAVVVPAVAAALVGFSYNALLSEKTRRRVYEKQQKKKENERNGRIMNIYESLPADLKKELKTIVDLQTRLEDSVKNSESSEDLLPSLREQTISLVQNTADTLANIVKLRNLMRTIAPAKLMDDIQQAKAKLNSARKKSTQKKMQEFLVQAEQQLASVRDLKDKEQELITEVSMAQTEIRRALTFVMQLGMGDGANIIAMQSDALRERVEIAKQVNREMGQYLMKTS